MIRKIAAAIILSHFVCIVVAYNYRDMQNGIEHSCYSASAETAFLVIIPFAARILMCGIFAYIFRRKAK